jgi:hypothetical protein
MSDAAIWNRRGTEAELSRSLVSDDRSRKATACFCRVNNACTRWRSLKLRSSGVAKRRQPIAMGVSPWNRVDNDGLSREAATEANMDVSESPPAIRACPGGSRASALRNRSESPVVQKRGNHPGKRGGGRRFLSACLRLQFDRPIDLADELGPAIDAGTVRSVERLPARLSRTSTQWHAGFIWSAIGFPRIAFNAGYDAVIPRGRAAP